LLTAQTVDTLVNAGPSVRLLAALNCLSEEAPMSAQTLRSTVPAVMLCASGLADGPIDIGSRRELFVDDVLIEKLRGARLVLHRPTPGEVATVHDEPWEGNTSGYHTVFQDGDLYRMYYRGTHVIPKAHKRTHPELICYAESTDGVRWAKPELGIVDFDGSKQNNIIWDGHGSHSFAVFKDANPACKPSARYKAIAYSKKRPQGLYVFKSADAIHWTPIRKKPVITATGDAQSVAFWDTMRNCYVVFHKRNRHDPKADKGSWLDVATATSDDFVHWTKSIQLQYPGAPNAHLYTNAITAYPRAPHILMGLPTRVLRLSRWGPPDIKHDQVSDVVLMASRDGQHFHRWSEAFIRPGLDARGWQRWGGHINNLPAWGIVETASAGPDSPRELSFYSTEGYFFPIEGCRMRRFTLRLDGFASVQAPLKGGELLTKPLVFAGNRLTINYSTSAAGSLRVELRDAAGKPIPGHSLRECPEIRGDEVERVVGWKGGEDVARVAGTPVRLRFILKDADLYSFRFTAR